MGKRRSKTPPIPPEPLTARRLEQLARSLVERGLASERILDSPRPAVREGEDR